MRSCAEADVTIVTATLEVASRERFEYQSG